MLVVCDIRKKYEICISYIISDHAITENSLQMEFAATVCRLSCLSCEANIMINGRFDTNLHIFATTTPVIIPT